MGRLDAADVTSDSETGSTLPTVAGSSKQDKDEDLPMTCQFCGISQPEFTDADKMDLHYVLQCQMLTNCVGCTQIIEVSAYNEHKLTQCSKKADFKQCPRCLMAIEADFYEQHITRLDCVPAQEEEDYVRCPQCQKDLLIEESEEKAWKDHLLVDRCAGANVRISTNAKARVSILRAKQPPASEVIMEEDDEDYDDGDTVGAKTPKRVAGVVGGQQERGRTTEMSRVDEED